MNSGIMPMPKKYSLKCNKAHQTGTANMTRRNGDTADGMTEKVSRSLHILQCDLIFRGWNINIALERGERSLLLRNVAKNGKLIVVPNLSVPICCKMYELAQSSG